MILIIVYIYSWWLYGNGYCMSFSNSFYAWSMGSHLQVWPHGAADDPPILRFILRYPLKMVIFHSYVSLPEGNEESLTFQTGFWSCDRRTERHLTNHGGFSRCLNHPKMRRTSRSNQLFYWSNHHSPGWNWSFFSSAKDIEQSVLHKNFSMFLRYGLAFGTRVFKTRVPDPPGVRNARSGKRVLRSAFWPC